MYLVTKLFTDLQDNDHLYEVGDQYPREGLEPSEERIAELMGEDNKQGVSLIKAVKGGDLETEEAAEPEGVKPAVKKKAGSRKDSAK